MFYKYMQEEKVIGVTEGISYITQLSNDCIVVGKEYNAMGCTVDGVNYHLKGKPTTNKLYQLVEAIEIEEAEYNQLKPLFEINPDYGLQNQIVDKIKNDTVIEIKQEVLK